jgi:hypothetical protein
MAIFGAWPKWHPPVIRQSQASTEGKRHENLSRPPERSELFCPVGAVAGVTWGLIDSRRWVDITRWRNIWVIAQQRLERGVPRNKFFISTARDRSRLFQNVCTPSRPDCGESYIAGDEKYKLKNTKVRWCWRQTARHERRRWKTIKLSSRRIGLNSKLCCLR